MIRTVMTSHYAVIKVENNLNHTNFSCFYILLLKTSCFSGFFLFFFFSVRLCSLLLIGKEVLLLMQALNTLSTPEEKLAALCKKYADLVSNL